MNRCPLFTAPQYREWVESQPGPPPVKPPSITAEDRAALVRRHFETMIEAQVIVGNLRRLETEQLVEAFTKYREKNADSPLMRSLTSR
jgi:hypothetical protein